MTKLSWTEVIKLDNNGIAVGLYKLNKEKGILDKYELYAKDEIQSFPLVNNNLEVDI